MGKNFFGFYLNRLYLNYRGVLIIGVLAFVVLLAIFNFFVLKTTNRNTPNISINSSLPKFMPNVLYPRVPDPTGRNIYYYIPNNGAFRFAGVGEHMYPSGFSFITDQGKTLYTVSTSSAFTNYIVGSFVKWENIPGSKDRYLVLKDRLGVRDAKGKPISMPKRIRIGFSLTGIDNKHTFATELSAENLSSVIPKADNSLKEVESFKMGLIGSYSSADIEKLIKPGDALAIVTIPKTSPNYNGDSRDSNENLIAGILLVRRFHPKEEISKELGKNIILYP